MSSSKIFVSHGGYQSPQAGIFLSEDGGTTFNSVPGLPNDYTGKSLISISSSNPDIIYISIADALEGRGLYRSNDGGSSWTVANTANVPTYQGWFSHDVAIKPDDPENVLWAGVEAYKSSDNGQNWEQMAGLPDRIPMEVVYHPGSSDTAYVVFSGFGTPHLYRTIDGGSSWSPLGTGLPDIPTNSIVVDPIMTTDLYVATDLGVYASFDKGENWEPYSNSVAAAMMAMHLSISPLNRKLRVATHGLGVYETDLRDPNVVSNVEGAASIANDLKISTYPNPVEANLTINYTLPESAEVSIQLMDATGRSLRVLSRSNQGAGIHQLQADLSGLPGGVYYYSLTGKWRSSGDTFRAVQKVVKQ